ncbi:MAG TPA: flavin reductase family protein [Polyangia bacterium]|nr:flavin reductase family protein [Polyangia bacterium]
MKIDPAAISSDAAYAWMVATILPRPIAWVSTLNEDGSANLAPFSFFTGVGSEPPTCLFCVGRKTKVEIGQKKDTWANVERAGEYVIHVVSDALAQAMNATSKEYPHGFDEFAAAGVTKAPSERVAPPRVLEAPVAMECRLRQLIEVGAPGDGTAVVIGEILLWHVADELLVAGRLDPGRLDAIGRMGGPTYARTRDRFDMPRPK